ncbi:hypothetical protein [Lishizhenia sp.]|uniref:hypothetical protein n=1 Tax=Lishizhenia sp. TaxID=2497594 RepID=UPI00299E57A5|nr:hypothetical protein [Lishizhenia sp.]MDX1445705.1 hypothetical protein [Lishizhenia sp.]
MKNEKIIFILGAVMATMGAAMKFFELPYATLGDILYKTTFVAITFYLAFRYNRLKKESKRLENNN